MLSSDGSVETFIPKKLLITNIAWLASVTTAPNILQENNNELPVWRSGIEWWSSPVSTTDRHPFPIIFQIETTIHTARRSVHMEGIIRDFIIVNTRTVFELSFENTFPPSWNNIMFLENVVLVRKKSVLYKIRNNNSAKKFYLDIDKLFVHIRKC